MNLPPPPRSFAASPDPPEDSITYPHPQEPIWVDPLGVDPLGETLEPAIMIASADATLTAALEAALAWLQPQWVIATTEDTFWQSIQTYTLWILILDSRFPSQEASEVGTLAPGLQLCQRLRQAAGHRTLPIFLLGDQGDGRFVERAFAAGATDYLTLPIHTAEVHQRVKTQLTLMSLQRRVMTHLDLQQVQQAKSPMKLLLFLQNQLRAQSDRLWAKNMLLEHEIQERQEAERALREAHQQSDRLLLNILPAPIADRLKSGEGNLADRYEEATILFADIVDFTPFSAQLTPVALMETLNEIFSSFDRLVEEHGLEKIKTIGDAYMVAGGVPLPRPDHAEAVMELAIAMRQEIRRFKQPSGKPLRLRIGINTGAVVAGVIGIRKFSYDLWGDAVNVASRMESQGLPGRIQVTASTYEQLHHFYNFEEWVVNIKGKGQMTTYFLVDRKPPRCSLPKDAKGL